MRRRRAPDPLILLCYETATKLEQWADAKSDEAEHRILTSERRARLRRDVERYRSTSALIRTELDHLRPNRSVLLATLGVVLAVVSTASQIGADGSQLVDAIQEQLSQPGDGLPGDSGDSSVDRIVGEIDEYIDQENPREDAEIRLAETMLPLGEAELQTVVAAMDPYDCVLAMSMLLGSDGDSVVHRLSPELADFILREFMGHYGSLGTYSYFDEILETLHSKLDRAQAAEFKGWFEANVDEEIRDSYSFVAT